MNKPIAEALVLLAAAKPGEPDWEAALCAQSDPEEWFPQNGQRTTYATRICRACPIQAECLAAAIRNNESYGVWGGATSRTRNAVVRLLGSAAQAAEPAQAPAGEDNGEVAA